MTRSMHVLTTVIPAGLVAYLLGSVPVGLLVGRARGVDVRTIGSRNIGATNVARSVGRPWGVLVFVLDMLKGLGPTLAGVGLLAGPAGPAAISDATRNLCVLLVGVSAVLGHNYSVFLRFRGGKGVATSLGVVLGIYPDLTYPGLVALAVWVVVTLGTRYVALGSMCAAATLPAALVLMNGRGPGSLATDWPLLGGSCTLAAMVILRHRGNLVRLYRGTERKIGKPERVD